jgi:hypothetical protein
MTMTFKAVSFFYLSIVTSLNRMNVESIQSRMGMIMTVTSNLLVELVTAHPMAGWIWID